MTQSRIPALLALALCGCAAKYPEYVSPTTGPTAQIKFTTAGAKVDALVFPDASCTNPTHIGTHEQFVTMPAGRPVYVMRRWDSMPVAGAFTYSHEFFVSFVLEPGKLYEMQYGQGFPKSVLNLMPLDSSGRRIDSTRPIIEHGTGKVAGVWPVTLPMTSVECTHPQR